ncbi:MAG TPA: hypothetical protein VM537_18250 [Anaerolineae bacterium]|nr:hypothetical protein [Anaerolineae bacterium]
MEPQKRAVVWAGVSSARQADEEKASLPDQVADTFGPGFAVLDTRGWK